MAYVHMDVYVMKSALSVKKAKVCKFLLWFLFLDGLGLKVLIGALSVSLRLD
jgi:hypothetical protein